MNLFYIFNLPTLLFFYLNQKRGKKEIEISNIKSNWESFYFHQWSNTKQYNFFNYQLLFNLNISFIILCGLKHLCRKTIFFPCSPPINFILSLNFIRVQSTFFFPFYLNQMKKKKGN